MGKARLCRFVRLCDWALTARAVAIDGLGAIRYTGEGVWARIAGGTIR